MKGFTPETKHTALFYYSIAEYLEIIVPYVREGLENEEFVFWSIPHSMKVEDAQSFLGQGMDDYEEYVKDKRIWIGDYRASYLEEGIFTSFNMLERFAGLEKEILARGLKGIRGTGDCSWAVDKYWPNFLIYESDLNSGIEKHKMKALCSYYGHVLDITQINDVGSRHQSSMVKQEGRWNKIGAERFTL